MATKSTSPKSKLFVFKRLRKKRCRLCSNKMVSVDFKDVEFLKNFITERAKIIPRRISGNCAKHQRMVTRAIKKAREAGLLPFTVK
ncbi:MAG: 30S ribosomal protein S18 [Candidatus Goldbacteria bacterium]|nr:30S ribosomal protein S18 [Candidatus Goldiibacteriota bacterium]